MFHLLSLLLLLLLSLLLLLLSLSSSSSSLLSLLLLLLLYYYCYYYLTVFSFTNIHESRDSRRKGRLFFTALYHCSIPLLLQRHWNISQKINAEGYPLQIASGRTGTGIPKFLSASHCYPVESIYVADVLYMHMTLIKGCKKWTASMRRESVHIGIKIKFLKEFLHQSIDDTLIDGLRNFCLKLYSELVYHTFVETC